MTLMIDKLLLEHVVLPYILDLPVHLGPCDFSVSLSPFDLDFGTLNFGLRTRA